MNPFMQIINNIRENEALQEMGPYQQIMATQYLQENPDVDFTGFPGYEALQRKYNSRVKAQMPFQKPEGRKKTSYGVDVPVGAQPRQAASQPTVGMGSSGFSPLVEDIGRLSNKDRIANKIMEKPEDQRSIMEKSFLNKYFGISNSKEGPKKPEDRLRIRKVAQDMAKADYIKEVGPDNAEDYVPSEEQTSEYIIDAAKYLYPNMEISEVEDLQSMMGPGEGEDMSQSRLDEEAQAGIDKYTAETASGKKINLDIQLPEGIKKASQALEFLKKQGMNEDEAREWLKARMK